jgi:hypothetical protein
VESFKELEPKVRQSIAANQNTISSAAEKIGEIVGKEASHATEQIARQLAEATQKTERALAQYEGEIIATQWKVIGISVFTTIITCLLLVWLLIPKPTLPLTKRQIDTLYNGQLLNLMWPKLSKEEQKRWRQLASEVTHPDPNQNGSN